MFTTPFFCAKELYLGMNKISVKHLSQLNRLDILAKKIVEGFISGMHKSPFHGFSVEFDEHKMYNNGESIKNVDWKLFAKTDRMYVKKYEAETNLRCHVIIDASSSMNYPLIEKPSLESLNKLSFSCYATAALMDILKRQRDAVGLSIYSDNIEFQTPEKINERHHHMLLAALERQIFSTVDRSKKTDTYKVLHQIAEKLHKRSLIFLFSDMFQVGVDQQELFEALRHLKYNKHELVLFHTYDKKLELDLDFGDKPKKMVDVETGESINVYSNLVREEYHKSVSDFFKDLKMKCVQYGISYVPVDINNGFESVLTSYLISRKKNL